MNWLHSIAGIARESLITISRHDHVFERGDFHRASWFPGDIPIAQRIARKTVELEHPIHMFVDLASQAVTTIGDSHSGIGKETQETIGFQTVL